MAIRTIACRIVMAAAVLALLLGCAAVQPAHEQQANTEDQSHGHYAEDPLAGLGKVEFPVSCTPEARQEFNRAVAMLHSFWFAPAIAGFNRAMELDSTCVMGYWGVAMSARRNPFAASQPTEALATGAAAVQEGLAVGAKTPREQAYLEAIAAFYKDYETVDNRTRALAHAEAMGEVATRFPEDTEATIFYALALSSTQPPTDKSYTRTLKAAGLLETIFKEQPNHPGVAHYLIHSYDYPALAERGLEAAKRYAQIAPAAFHALHMPGHIFTRRGLWQESVDTNRASEEVARHLLAAQQGRSPELSWTQMLHPMDYRMYAHLQLSQDREARALLEEIGGLKKVVTENFGAAYALAAISSRYAVERGRWDEAARLTLHPAIHSWDRFGGAQALLIFARALGAARSGDVASAKGDLERLRRIEQAGSGYWAGQVKIQATEVSAWIALAEGRKDDALALMREATGMEDATEKHPVSPGLIKPSHELLGEMLLELGQPATALTEFETSQQIEPNRFMGWYGAGRAAELAGKEAKAKDYYSHLVEQAALGDAERAEVRQAQEYLARLARR